MSDPNKPTISRRSFIRQSAEAITVTAVGAELLSTAEAAPPVRTAADWVSLGKLNKQKIKIPRVGMGTGTVNGKTQRDLGQEGFNKLVKHAYDRGVRYIDTADNYKTHEFVREAIKANKLPRESIFIQTKLPIRAETTADPLKTIDRYRKELGVDTIDSLLIHCATKGNWILDQKALMDAFDEAQHKGWIKTKGCSCHGLTALREATRSDWMEVQLARVNPQGHLVDGDHPTNPHHPEGKVAEAMKEIKAMHDKGRGIIGMKLVGEGAFVNPEDREKAIRYAMTCGFVDAVVIGFKNTAEIDEAVERINRVLSGKV
ncbi:MAG TPA: aldo/keto reductase [Blastocatellia bacterium]|jgi:predicted aldo/keto reductase-like oxidoreductase